MGINTVLRKCFHGNSENIDTTLLLSPACASFTTYMIGLYGVARSKYFKAYFVYGKDTDYSKVERQTTLEKIGNELNLKNIALTFVPSFTDTESEATLNKINPSVANTFILYRNRTIIDKFINLNATEENFKLLAKELDNNKGNYFDLE